MYKKILVPTDASEYSLRAFQTAVKLAKLFQAEIVLIHVTYAPQSFWGNAVPYGYVFAQEDVIKSAQQVVDSTRAEAPAEEVQIRTVLEIGHPVIKIIDQIEKDDIDLVVIGSHGYGPITGSVLGSVSQRVLQKSPVPVLLVK